MPVAIRLARREGIDVVITTSPPPSLHLLGAAVKRASGAAWVADLRDPLTSHPHRRGYESRLAQLKEKTVGGVGGSSRRRRTRSSPRPTRSPRRRARWSRRARS